MRWIAWGFRVVDGEKEAYKVGELVCESLDLTALILARRRFGHMVVDHVQSALSYEIDLLEAPDKLVFKRHHPRRYKKKKKRGPFGEALNDAGPDPQTNNKGENDGTGRFHERGSDGDRGSRGRNVQGAPENQADEPLGAPERHPAISERREEGGPGRVGASPTSGNDLLYSIRES